MAARMPAWATRRPAVGAARVRNGLSRCSTPAALGPTFGARCTAAATSTE